MHNIEKSEEEGEQTKKNILVGESTTAVMRTSESVQPNTK